MKKLYGSVLSTTLLMVLVLGYYVTKNPIKESYLASPQIFNLTNPLEWINPGTPPAFHIRETSSQVISTEVMLSEFFVKRNLTIEEQNALQTWNRLKPLLLAQDKVLPNAIEAIKEACVAWKNLIHAMEEENLQIDGSLSYRGKEKQCPHFLSKINVSKLDDNGFKLRVPCGLTQGSSISLIGIPNGLLGDFRIDLTAEPLPGEPDPPIILHYNVRLHGDKITEDPVIVQNTWTIAHDWGEERRCPLPDDGQNKKVDELDQCNELVGKEGNRSSKTHQHASGSKKISMVHDGIPRKFFPFRQNDLFVSTLRVGLEGIQMTVDGRLITSFAFREGLEPWLISEMKISGDLELISIVASGLPTSEDLEHIIDLEALKANPLPPRRQLNLVIGVFSNANNFKRRMAVRRTWMQYAQVRSGQVAVRFFVGLHKSQIVNEELWNEARTYEDVQLMPFVDYYSLITWKTIAICIFGTRVVSAKFIMKTDDDAFVRVDEILTSLGKTDATRGLFYGLINSDSEPDRNPDSKWYISPEDWPHDKYPPWAHGPGYIVSNDIAKAITKKHEKGLLKMFKLEDVAMGIWVADMKKNNRAIRYENDGRIIIEGCTNGYVVAHYQGPRELLCLWQNIQDKKISSCCAD